MTELVDRRKIYGGWLQAFENQFPNRASRLAIARLLPDGQATLPDFKYPSDPVLAAHWGEPSKKLTELANRVYDTGEAVSTHLGQAAVILTRGNKKALNDASGLYEPLTLLTGVIASSETVTSIGGSLRTRGRANRGVQPPYIKLSTTVRLRDVQGLEIDLADDGCYRPVNVNSLSDTDQLAEVKAVEIYGATIPLHCPAPPDDISTINWYDGVRQSQAYDYVVGNKAVHRFMRALVETDELLLDGTGLRYRTLATPDMPVPSDLSQVFRISAVQEEILLP